MDKCPGPPGNQCPWITAPCSQCPILIKYRDKLPGFNTTAGPGSMPLGSINTPGNNAHGAKIPTGTVSGTKPHRIKRLKPPRVQCHDVGSMPIIGNNSGWASLFRGQHNNSKVNNNNYNLYLFSL